MIKKITKLLVLLIVGLMFSMSSVSAQDNLFLESNEEVNIYFFWAYGCPHCSDEKPFLEQLENKYENLNVHSFEVTNNKENVDLLKKVGQELNVNVSGVPFTVIGEQYFTGWYNEETTGAAIEEAIKCSLQDGCYDAVGLLINPQISISGYKDERKIPEKMNLPFLGQVEIKNLSLPVLTILLGALDGFNPCAMWVLLFLISLLLRIENKKRRWTLGFVFIFSSAFVYFLFMSAWLNLFLFLGFVLWVRVVIGFVALASGVHNLKEYFTNKSGKCKVTSDEKKQKIFEKLKNITQEKRFLIAVIGIILLAFAVNLVELICSFGLPAIYTQTLLLTNLEVWQYYAYLLFYILIFMLDDLIIFCLAMKTLEITGATTKYIRISHLVGGIIMLFVGILLLLKPELLMFG